MPDRRCGTCAHWEGWACNYPMPDIGDWSTYLPVAVPASLEITYRCMTANRGLTCPCWEQSQGAE